MKKIKARIRGPDEQEKKGKAGIRDPDGQGKNSKCTYPRPRWAKKYISLKQVSIAPMG